MIYLMKVNCNSKLINCEGLVVKLKRPSVLMFNCSTERLPFCIDFSEPENSRGLFGCHPLETTQQSDVLI